MEKCFICGKEGELHKVNEPLPLDWHHSGCLREYTAKLVAENARLREENEKLKARAIAGEAFEENLLRQRASMMISERFPSITHIVDDMAEALLNAESQRDAAAMCAEKMREALKEASKRDGKCSSEKCAGKICAEALSFLDGEGVKP